MPSTATLLQAVVVLLVCTLVGCPPAGHAQTLDAPAPSASLTLPCPPRNVPSSADPLIRSLVTEWGLLTQHWCKVVRWDDTWPHLQDFLVHVFTGPGVHPTAGVVVPGSGAAAGLALNTDWRDTAPPYARFVTNVEARGSVDGFWEAGGKLQTLFAGSVANGKALRFTLSPTHQELPHLPFYGLGNDSPRDGRTFYGLSDTAIVAGVDVPLPYGFTLSGGLDGLWFVPEPSASFDAVHTEATAPGRHARTTYLRPRASVAWQYPFTDVLDGFSTLAVVSQEFYQSLSGGAFAFSRLEARWNVAFHFDPEIGTVGFLSRLVLSNPYAGNKVPFYLQPTVGGGDLNNENFLRSYADYRFRASNLIVYELFYERKILDPVGLRIFGELGKVGIHPGDLGFADLKSSVGVSVTVRLGGAPVFELSFAWGGGEGMQIYSTGNTNNIGGVTAGLRGVF
jgi:hypothetical protein